MRALCCTVSRLLVLLAVTFATSGSWAAEQATPLDAYVGKDLWQPPFSRSRALAKFLGAGKCTKQFGTGFEAFPWHVWTTMNNGIKRYVVLSASRMLAIPGGSSACLQLFDGAARRIASWSFYTGWRVDLVGASFQYSPHTGTPVVALRTVPVMNGGWQVGNEYFALRDDQLFLLRIERADGDLIQNEYIAPDQEIGLAPDATTEDQWAKMLQSSDNAVVLSALVFLGGRHIPATDDPVQSGRSQYSELFEQLLASTRISGLIVGLMKSDDDWVRQAAIFANRGPRDRRISWH